MDQINKLVKIFPFWTFTCRSKFIDNAPGLVVSSLLSVIRLILRKILFYVF